MTGDEVGRYKEFRNFLHNTLQITKADIVEWTENAVEAVVLRSIETGKLDLQAALDRAMYRAVRSALRLDEMFYTNQLAERILEQAAKRIEVKVR